MADETEQTVQAKLHDLFINDFGDNIEVTDYKDEKKTPNLGFTYKLHKDCFCSNNSFFCDKPCCANIIRFVTKITIAVKKVLKDYDMEKINLNELGITHDDTDNFTFDACKFDEFDESNFRKFTREKVFPFTSVFGIKASQLNSRTKQHSVPVVVPQAPMNDTQKVEEEKPLRPTLDDNGVPYVLGGGSHSRRKRRSSKKSRKSRRRPHRRSSHNKKRHTKRHTKRYRKRK